MMSKILLPGLVGFNAHMGFQPTKWLEDYYEMTLEIEAMHINSTGSVHGGVYATMIDATMGFACCYTGDPAFRSAVVTLSMTVNYINTVNKGKIFAQASRTGGGKSVCFGTGKIFDEAGNLLVTASGTFKRLAALVAI
jgi:uncharacterized protein (TIGR00369 family)